MPFADISSSANMAPLKISIPSAHDATPEHGKAYTEYTIKIEPPSLRVPSAVSKRYSDFTALDAALRSEAGAAPPVALPAKSWGIGGILTLGLASGTATPEAIEKRRAGLEEYLRAIESADDARWRTCKSYRAFLHLDDKESKKPTNLPGSQFGKDRILDSSDWLQKHADVKRSLQDARNRLTDREQATAAGAQHEAAAKAKQSLLRASTLISALEEYLTRGSGGSDDWSGEKLGDGEIRRRRDMLSSARKEKESLDTLLSSMAVKPASTTPSSSATVSAEQKAGLFHGASKPASRRVLGAPQETDRTRELDNDGVLQLQKQIIADQDEDLVDLTTVVRRMREMGVQINTEIVEQNALLGLLEEDVERVDGKIRIAKKRIGKIK